MLQHSINDEFFPVTEHFDDSFGDDIYASYVWNYSKTQPIK